MNGSVRQPTFVGKPIEATEDLLDWVRREFGPRSDIERRLREGQISFGVSEQLIGCAQAQSTAASEERSSHLWRDVMFSPLSADDAGWSGLGFGVGALYAGKTGAPVAGLVAALAARIAKARSR